MRLFVALELPEAVRREAGRRASAHKGRLPHARWTHPDNLHLTLAFLGEVEEPTVPRLVDTLTAAFAARPPLTLRLAGAGTFPPPAEEGREGRRGGGRPARVAWIGLDVEEGEAQLLALQKAADVACRSVLDLPPENRPYAPHLTIARPKDPWRRRAAEDFVAAFEAPIGEPFHVAAGSLVRSELGAGPGGGSRYTTVSELPLRGAEAGAVRHPEATEPVPEGEAP